MFWETWFIFNILREKLFLNIGTWIFIFYFFPGGSKIKGLKKEKEKKKDLDYRSYIWSIAIIPSQYKSHEIFKKITGTQNHITLIE